VKALEESAATARALARGQDGALEEEEGTEGTEETAMDQTAVVADEMQPVADGSDAATAAAAAVGSAASAGLVAQVAVPMELDGSGEREAAGGMPPTGVAEAVQRGAALPPSKPSSPPPSEASAGEIAPAAGEIAPAAGEIAPAAGEIAPAAGEIVQAEPLFDLPPELVVPVRMGEQPPGEQQPAGTAAVAAEAVANGRGLGCQG